MNETQKGSDLLGGAPADEPGLPGFDPAGGETAAGYRVLARKYRPRTFDDLIGQDAMVRTIANAFDAGRIPQAWMLTGVRGVGKTTTARILARGLNYELPDGVDGGKSAGPTIHMPQLGLHCQAIIDGNHIDVMEIDAASNNGVENVRQITDAVRYSPVSARYKVYIIDEVHMLSAAAFNAFLKTLEEPPPHAKFVFATTEIRKVPVTILSRCQRFDLRRVDAGPADRAFEKDLRGRACQRRRRGARADRAGRRRLGARRPVAARSGHRPRQRRCLGRDGSRHARSCRPRPHHRPIRGGDAWRSCRPHWLRSAGSMKPAPIQPSCSPIWRNSRIW